MKRAFASLFCALFCLSGCAPKAIVIDPIAPAAAKAAGFAANTEKAAARSQTHAASVSVEAHSIAAAAMTATAEVDRLRKADGVTPGEFDALWSMVTGLQTQTAAHAKMAAAAEAAATETRIAADETGSVMDDLSRTAVHHDAAVVDLKTQVASQAADAANGRLLKWVLIGAAVIGALLLAAKFIPR